MTKWIVALVTLFGIGTLLSGLLEWQYFGSQQAGVFYTLLTGFKDYEWSNPLVAIGSMVTIAWAYIVALWNIFWFNYAFFEGSWVIVKYIVFWPISIGLVVTLILSRVTRTTV